MSTRYFALILGIVYILIGLMGFIPALVTAPAPGDPMVAMSAGYGRLLGIFPINTMHNIVHLVIGLWGILAYRSFDASRTYSIAVAIIFAILTIMGVIPGLNTMFGMAPLFGNDIWLHALTAILGAYFGVVASGRTPATIE